VNYLESSLYNLSFAANKLKEVTSETAELSSKVENLHSEIFADMKILLNGLSSISSLSDLHSLIEELKSR